MISAVITVPVIGLTLASALLLTACGQADVSSVEAVPQVVAESVPQNTSSQPVGDSAVGMRVEDFQLIDQNGAAHQLYYYDNATAIVIMTQGNGCPIVRNAMPALRDVRDAYADKGVAFFLLNSNLQDNAKSIAAEVEEFGFDLPVLVDENQLVGESLGVTRTAEVFVIHPTSKKVVYHGPVDDRLHYQTQKAEADNAYLVNALDAVLAGVPVTVAEVEAPGCLVNFPERDRRAQHAQISYHDTIAPLLEERCVGCHTEGGIGPWAMNSYDMVKGFAPMIREVIRTDRMPPWNADPNVGHFQGDKSLRPDEIKTLVHWIEAGAPRGEGPDPLAVPRELPAEWPLGEPDLIVSIPPFDVPAGGVVDYQYPMVLNPMTEGRWLRAATVNVGARQSVHHVLSGHMAEVPENHGPSERNWGVSVGGYAVGAESNIAPENTGSYVPAGGAFGFQMHYTPFGKAVTDDTRIGLYFYDETPDLVTHRSVILDVSLEIPPNTGRHVESAYMTFPKDAVLSGAFPHAHYRGQSSTLTLRYPDGKEELILSLPKYDFNWQREYEFAQPIDVPAGSKLIAVYEYDNTPANPANPDPSDQVHWGEQSHEEMLFTAFNYRWKEETSDNLLPHYDAMLDSTRGFGMLDDNIDGVLERHELKGSPGQQIAEGFDSMDRDGDGMVSWDEYGAMLKARSQQVASTD
jgi:peroxiredoxin